MPLDHFSINVPLSKLDGVIAFLTSSLKHLGLKEIVRPVPFVVGLGEKAPYFWITGIDPDYADEKTQELLSKKQHVAFTAESKSISFPVSFVDSAYTHARPGLRFSILTDLNIDAEQVREFHTAALKAGGTCNGPPGLREHYHPGYYGAFVRDPECGLNFEVVCHKGDI